MTGATIQQVRSAGGTGIKEARRTGIIFANLSKTQADRLRAMGCQVFEVGKVAATVMPPTIAPPAPVEAAPTYSLEQLVEAAGYDELRMIIDPPLYGSGFSIAIIDTGIRETHEKIDRVVYSKNYTSDPMEDGFDHGTGVCSVVLAVSPLCNVLNLKVLDEEGDGSEEDVVMAIDDCIDLHDTQSDIAPSVINLSLGTPDDGNPNNPMRVACRAATDKGIWVFASVGNEGPTPGTITSPACERYVAAVGSLKYEPLVVSSWSGRGPTKEGLVKPDIVIFGEDVAMASSESDTATIAKSGTSFAVPFASSMGLLYHEGLYRKARQIEQVLGMPPGEIYFITMQEALDIYLPLICVKPEGVAAGKDYDYGYGLPYGPLITQSLGLEPIVGISTLIMPLIVIGMMGAMMPMMTEGMK